MCTNKLVTLVFSALRVHAIQNGKYVLSGLVFLLGLAPVVTNAVRCLYTYHSVTLLNFSNLQFADGHVAVSYVKDPVLGSYCNAINNITQSKFKEMEQT